jgi:hypothetical protein
MHNRPFLQRRRRTPGNPREYVILLLAETGCKSKLIGNRFSHRERASMVEAARSPLVIGAI